ncbi:mucin-22, partial [Aphis craccivora]
VNISSSWLLPQNEFPVFYRHFRDRVTWFEADAVCQFHHAQLATDIVDFTTVMYKSDLQKICITFKHSILER